ncbi:hypothetical protein D9613_011558 [Agrocybe pediades]|uniref:Uncharacterized protein n=1 Tax=Agrocybe pediades TaxID=84607 RepID=A0A8H4QWY5_9AGAR|nr:hypothetical protein D9613_011558 [Agrocybe pediades]
MPIHAVPKPNSSEFRLVTDHSAGKFSLNSMIDHDRVTGFPLDNLKHLGEMLLHFRRNNPSTRLTMWKCDVAEAYRLMPMDPRWQMKQITTVDGERYVDRNNAFGTCSSGAIWIGFFALVAWIAKYVLFIAYLIFYVDDVSSFNKEGDLSWYEPYKKSMPRSQADLLRFWDLIGVQHKEKKQISGPCIPVIGIMVDPNAMTFTLPNDKKQDLIAALESWTVKRLNNHPTAFKLKYWQQIAGWMNWALNVFPHLRPALNNVYAKTAGPWNPHRSIKVNNAVRDDFQWAIYHLKKSDGVHLLRSSTWPVELQSWTIYCDACLEGMGFWYPHTNTGFFCPTPSNTASHIIFYFEALTVLCALIDVASKCPSHSRVVIYTDNMNTVTMFNTLSCPPQFNPLLRAAMDVVIDNDLQLRVLHIAGEDNFIADALSRVQFSAVLNLVPDMTIQPFSPPQWTLGAASL